MLNYNYNIIAPISNKRNASDSRPLINWEFNQRTSVAANPNQPALAFATMSIIASSSNATSVIVNSTGFFTSGGSLVSASMSGSGVWPVTGSTTMSISATGIPSISGETPLNFSSVLNTSAQAGNMNLSGSIISINFNSPSLYTWYINGNLVHYKGNQYNPLVTWKQSNLSPLTTTGNVNGYTSSFNIVKDANVSLVNIAEATGSTSSSFQYDYNFGVTASYTASINNVTGSTTMSFSIPEAGVDITKYFFNETTTTAITTASFVATNDNPYNITASISYNKGNISNSVINWYDSGSTKAYASFSIVKNANESLVANNISTIFNGSFTNNYAFNITSSISGGIKWPNSSSFQSLTMSISIPEIGLYNSTNSTASIVTASFAANTAINPYNITASIKLDPYPSYSLSEYVFIGKGGNGSSTSTQTAGSGGGAGALVSGSGMVILPDSVYIVNIGDGEAAPNLGATTFILDNQKLIVAPNGGDGTAQEAGSYGGSGGGASGGNISFRPPPDNIGGASWPSTGSGIFFTNITGSKGGNGAQHFAPTPFPPNGFAIAGGGGGAAGPGETALACCCTGHYEGGPGVPNNMITFITGVTGSFSNGGFGGWGPSGCSPGTDPLCTAQNFNRNGINFGDGGKGGTAAENTGTNTPLPGGTGANGIAIIKYAGTQKGRGGSITYDGTYTYHTFTSSGLFYSTANLQPIKH